MNDTTETKFYVFEPAGTEMPSVIVVSSLLEVKPAYLRERLELQEPKEMSVQEIVKKYGINDALQVKWDMELGGTYLYRTNQ
jgi:hypothetical protein